jgi:hypothetical protein
MITIEYDPDALAVADSWAERFVMHLVEKGKDTEAKVSTENVIQAARALMLREGIEVQFKYKGEIITPNKYGAIHRWPDGFCTYVQNWIKEVVRTAIEMKKADGI